MVENSNRGAKGVRDKYQRGKNGEGWRTTAITETRPVNVCPPLEHRGLGLGFAIVRDDRRGGDDWVCPPISPNYGQFQCYSKPGSLVTADCELIAPCLNRYLSPDISDFSQKVILLIIDMAVPEFSLAAIYKSLAAVQALDDCPGAPDEMAPPVMLRVWIVSPNLLQRASRSWHH
ncbi:hypothetical protein CALVIDRAFT_124948 [Calocera viscosa TUFC12733]|uniref:Uncharacterized protein n=1 Tax=Calocera viscosa (strain TUFC12733) TaxID=1330018 RepID=A0A167RQ75_CALVF|nr:hypothetical protein CALVIDRAFT_124948 [Calocera viscosa TUFC12733]